MISKETLFNAIINLENYLVSEDYIGYDPYDTLLSPIPFNKMGKLSAMIVTQVQKRNPINIRSLIGINKEYNPKAMGLFLNAYSNWYRITGEMRYLEKAGFFFNWLRNNFSAGYSGYCWGYNFPWVSSDNYVDKFVPSAVVTGFVTKGIYEYWKITKDGVACDVLKGAANFVRKDLLRFNDKNGLCFSYTPLMQDICYNSSLLATEILLYDYLVNSESHNLSLIKSSLNFVLSKQLADGRWNYSMNLYKGVEREQIDFHQGFILESIYTIIKDLDLNNEKYLNSISRGLKFYMENQFYNKSISYWRLPRKYPIEIHNQAQGIITFSKLSSLNESCELYAKNIAQWTISKMQSKLGYFYYRKYRYYNNKISFMRWSQAWMFLALTNLFDIFFERTTRKEFHNENIENTTD